MPNNYVFENPISDIIFNPSEYDIVLFLLFLIILSILI